MKLIGLIAVLVVLATGCQKEQIRPADPTSAFSVMKAPATNPEGDSKSNTQPTTGAGGAIGSAVGGVLTGGAGDTGITDPNNDPSGERKKKH